MILIIQSIIPRGFTWRLEDNFEEEMKVKHESFKHLMHFQEESGCQSSLPRTLSRSSAETCLCPISRDLISLGWDLALDQFLKLIPLYIRITPLEVDFTSVENWELCNKKSCPRKQQVTSSGARPCHSKWHGGAGWCVWAPVRDSRESGPKIFETDFFFFYTSLT